MPERRRDETLPEFLDRTNQWDSWQEKVDMFEFIVAVLQDETIPSEEIRARIFERIPREVVEQHVKELDDWIVEDG